MPASVIGHSGDALCRILQRRIDAKGELTDPVHPIRLLFNIWAMAQSYADFEARIRAVPGKVSIEDARFAAAAEGVGPEGLWGAHP